MKVLVCNDSKQDRYIITAKAVIMKKSKNSGQVTLYLFRKENERTEHTKVKQERAQGGCLGTESRRKT